jgi:hypothetical protein
MPFLQLRFSQHYMSRLRRPTLNRPSSTNVFSILQRTHSITTWSDRTLEALPRTAALRKHGTAVLVKTDPSDRGRTAVLPAATPGAEAADGKSAKPRAVMRHISSLRLMVATLDDLLSSVQHPRRDLRNSSFSISTRYRRLLCLLALILPYPFLVPAWSFFVQIYDCIGFPLLS